MVDWDHIRWFADCECGWTSKAYRHEGWAERAARKHLLDGSEWCSTLVVWLLPHETGEQENVS